MSLSPVSPCRAPLVQAVREVRLAYEHMACGERNLAFLSWAWAHRHLGVAAERGQGIVNFRRQRRVERLVQQAFIDLSGVL